MIELDALDIVVLVVVLVGSVAYYTKGKLWSLAPGTDGGEGSRNGVGVGAGQQSRDIIQTLAQREKNCVIFFGSQTGTAEDYAARLAKEGSQRFGLKTMVAGLEDYDFDNLNEFPADKLAVFVLATYGEGEPTDNAIDFHAFVMDEDAFSGEETDGDGGGAPLSNLKYVAFGLGNTTYEHYNHMIRTTDDGLQRLGAHRIGDRGEGDDGSGNMEEDFLAWKEPMWAAVAKEFDLAERENGYEPTFDITERSDVSPDAQHVYLGEPTSKHLSKMPVGPHGTHNPYIASIVESRELFQSAESERNCLHMEIDLAGSGLTYETGDHIAIWPHNPSVEVDRFLRVFGLDHKRDTVIDVRPMDMTAKTPMPTPTTYETAIRYYMEICGPASRQFFSQLAAFAPDEGSRAELKHLGEDKEYFIDRITNRYLNVAQALQEITPKPFATAPFSLLIEGIPKLQYRYYSISSSSLVQKDVASITAVVESVHHPNSPHVLKGVTTNYLLALKHHQHGGAVDASNANASASASAIVSGADGLGYVISGPRNKLRGIRVPVHIRHSNFKLPSNPARPVIMVGPGTGVAPFRAFVQERAHQASQGEKVGPTVLFFGCRREREDFLYSDEWRIHAEKLGPSFQLITAFSRDCPQKVYVQHRLREHAQLVNSLLQQKANVYVCGDAANMAREVNNAVAEVVAAERSLDPAQAEEVVKRMRSQGTYQEDIW